MSVTALSTTKGAVAAEKRRLTSINNAIQEQKEDLLCAPHQFETDRQRRLYIALCAGPKELAREMIKQGKARWN